MGHTQDLYHKQFEGIQALRGIAALFIFFQHIRFLNTGSCGVDILLCISGFIAMYSTGQNSRHFLLKRVLRILPLYWLVTILLYFATLHSPSLFQTTKDNPSFLLKSLFFLPFEISPGIVQPLLRVGWTLNYEMLFYVLFSLSMRISYKYRGIICSLFLGLFAIFPLLFSQAIPSDNIILSFWCDSILLEFILGILGYYIVFFFFQKRWQDHSQNHMNAHTKKSKRFLGIFGCITGICLLLGMFLFQNDMNLIGYKRVLYFGIPSFLLLLCSFTAEKHLLTLKPLIQLGNMSYSFYLFHYPIILFVDRRIYNLERISPKGVVIVLITFLLLYLLSYLSWYYIERKFTKALRSFFHISS